MSNDFTRRSADDTESETESGPSRMDGVSRRKLMAAGAAGWATVGLAGCVDVQGEDCEEDGGGTTDGGGGGGGTNDGTSNVTVTTQTTTTGGGTPTEDGGGGGGGTTTECEQQSIFAPGMDVGFLVSVFDNFTGDKLDADELATVVLEFPYADIDSVELTPSGPHENYVPDKWGGKASVPVDAEPGTYRYEISVATDPDEDPEPVVTDELELVEISL